VKVGKFEWSREREGRHQHLMMLESPEESALGGQKRTDKDWLMGVGC
jgi:hypothetical protein